MHNFDQEIVEVYAMLSDGQEPLGAEFEAIWNDNLSQLYNS